jgi:effector-binding domain-containing protein
MPYQVAIVGVQPTHTAVVRRQASQADLPKVVPQGCGEVWSFLRSQRIPQPGRNLAVYFDGVINLEVGVEVGNPFVGDGNVLCSSIPAGRAATTAHVGPYNRLGDAYDAIHQWCASHGHALAGPSWEIYGHWIDDPDKLRTDVYCLLR